MYLRLCIMFLVISLFVGCASNQVKHNYWPLAGSIGTNVPDTIVGGVILEEGDINLEVPSSVDILLPKSSKIGAKTLTKSKVTIVHIKCLQDNPVEKLIRKSQLFSYFLIVVFLLLYIYLNLYIIENIRIKFKGDYYE